MQMIFTPQFQPEPQELSPMSNTTNELSVAALERLLERRRSQLTSLKRRRGQLEQNLKKVDRRITDLTGSAAGTMKSVARRLRKRPKNAKPLSVVVDEILSKSKTGYPLAKLSEKVLASGYKSGSSNFKNVLYQTLYNDTKIVHDAKSGNYRLKGGLG